jgi:hypothetical protein
MKGELADFGSTSRGVERHLPRLVVGGAVATLVVGTLWGVLAERQTIAQSTADTNLAAIVGPPCPAISAATARQSLQAQGVTMKYVFDFNGDTFGRVFGYADCSVAASKVGLGSYDVCQFTGPSVLYVKTAHSVAYFAPGVGHKATVMTENGVPRCVMAAPAWDD